MTLNGVTETRKMNERGSLLKNWRRTVEKGSKDSTLKLGRAENACWGETTDGELSYMLREVVNLFICLASRQKV